MSTKTNRHQDVKICSINVCGLSARSRLMLDKYNNLDNFDILNVQETGSVVEEKLKLTNMNVITDSNSSINRGTATYVKTDTPFTKISEISNLTKEIDSTWCLAVIDNKRFIIGNVYVKLNYQHAIADVIQMLKAAQAKAKQLKAYSIILTGDFNARHFLWGDEVSNEYGKKLVDQLDHTAFSIVSAASPTFICENGSSNIDLMIVSNNLTNKVESCVTNDDVELFSGAPMRGHVPLIVEIKSDRVHTGTPVTEKIDINAVNWELWTQELERKLESNKSEITRYKSPDQLWKYFVSAINETTEKHSVKKRSCRHSKPFWTKKLTTLCSKMIEARKSYKKRNTDINRRKMEETKEEFDTERKEECQNFILEKTKKLNAAEVKTFWREFNRIFKKKTERGVEPLDDAKGGLLTDMKDMEGKLFETFFQCKHMMNVDFDDYFYETVNDLYEGIISEDIYNVDEDYDQQELNAPISIDEILTSIKKTDPNKVSFDNYQMHPKMLHSFGDRAIKLTQRLFNLSVAKSKWVWNQAEVIFLKKEGKETYAAPGSYRPISITSYIGKLLEKIIAARLGKFLSQKGHYDPNQEGFTAERNTVRYLNRLNLEIKSDLLDKKTVIALFVDMEKAFDSVWKRGLIVKLSNLNIKGKVLHLIDNFLTSRMVTLNVNNHKGEERECEAYGLPQGSALSPILFKIYLMDMLEELQEKQEISLLKFADDATVKIACATTDQCISMMNIVTDEINRWIRKWRMVINCKKDKTEYICFGVAEAEDEIPESVKIGEKIVNKVDKTKVLGLTIDSKLSYIPHSQEVYRNICGKWATICQYTNIHWGFNQRVLTQLINTLFASVIQYAGHIWIQHRNFCDIDKMWTKLIKSAVGSIFNMKTNIGEIIIGVPPVSIQTTMNRIKHYLKLNISQTPEDKLKKYVKDCTNMSISQPVEMKKSLKDIFKFLKWKMSASPINFTESDRKIIDMQDHSKFCELTLKSCSYTKTMINKYIEKIWYDKLCNQGLVDGDQHIPVPKYQKLPIPRGTTRSDEVLLMSLFYPQNLLNSFVYRHTYQTESPLCSRCKEQEETSFHIIYECNEYLEEMHAIVGNLIETEVQQADCTTLLNCSRDERFIKLCLTVLQQGEYRQGIDLN